MGFKATPAATSLRDRQADAVGAADDELETADIPRGGEIATVSSEPWESPDFGADVSERVAERIDLLIESGDAERLVARVRNLATRLATDITALGALSARTTDRPSANDDDTSSFDITEKATPTDEG